MNCIANIAINTLCTMEIILTTKEMPLLTTLSVKNVNGNIMDTQENMNIPTPKLKDHYFPILDQGFIALKDVMGTDEDIEQAARVSYQGGTRKTSETRGLLRYCMSHGHTSIFEQVVLKLHVKAPILERGLTMKSLDDILSCLMLVLKPSLMSGDYSLPQISKAVRLAI